jgi:hypothetical protein
MNALSQVLQSVALSWAELEAVALQAGVSPRQVSTLEPTLRCVLRWGSIQSAEGPGR